MRLQPGSIQTSLVIDLPEEADFEASCWLKDKLQKALAEFEGRVILNLNPVTSMGSHCIGTMLTFASETSRKSREFRVVCPEGNVRRQIHHARLDKILPIYETLDEAVAAPANQRPPLDLHPAASETV